MSLRNADLDPQLLAFLVRPLSFRLYDREQWHKLEMAKSQDMSQPDRELPDSSGSWVLSTQHRARPFSNYLNVPSQKVIPYFILHYISVERK